MKSNIILCLLFTSFVSLEASEKDYAHGMSLYNSKQYEKAFPIVFEEAQDDNKAAQYRLAEMYENGRGIKKDFEQAMYWYKLSSEQYAYIESDQYCDINASYLTQVENQFGDDSIKRGNEFALAKMDTSTTETKTLIKSLTRGDFFGLEPYNANYLLPISYSNDKPSRVSTLFHKNNLPAGYNQSDLEYDKNTEVEFQLSLKKQLSYNLFGLNEYIYFAYTQKVWWQLYSESGPFRETNYLPEVFISVPSSQKIDASIGLKTVKYGFLHESNGQEGYRSRSWNRLYATGIWQLGNLFLATRVWYRIPEKEKTDGYYNGALVADYANENGDDNPDIEKYIGYGDIKLDYLNGKSQYTLLLRNNLRMNSDNKGAIEASWSYPFFSSPNTFWYAKVFNGYGDSLIDYNNEVTKIAFGFSFSRGLL